MKTTISGLSDKHYRILLDTAEVICNLADTLSDDEELADAHEFLKAVSLVFMLELWSDGTEAPNAGRQIKALMNKVIKCAKEYETTFDSMLTKDSHD
jgi:hypothetical protein